MHEISRGQSPKTTRIRNNALLFSLLRAGGALPVRTLARDSGLSKTAVQKILGGMMDSGTIISAGKGSSTDSGGKRPETYQLRPDLSFSISVLFSARICRAELYDLHMHIRDREEFFADPAPMDYERTLQAVSRLICRLLERNPEAGLRLSGVAFMTSGIISYVGGMLINPIPNHHWGRNRSFLADISPLLGLGCPLYLDNMVRFDSYSRLYSQPTLRRQNAVILNYYNEGLGGSVLRHGHLVHGMSGLVGEFGHITTDLTRQEVCNCGRTGCIESIVRHSRILSRTRQMLRYWPSSLLQGKADLTFDDISDAADSGDELGRRQMDLVVQQFASLLDTLRIAYDPDTMILKCFCARAPMTYFCSQLYAAADRTSLSEIHSPLVIQVEHVPSADSVELTSVPGMLGGAHFCFDRHYGSFPEEGER